MTSPRETVLCRYHYDPLDRLISHALPDIPERQRFYCKSRLATEIQGAMRFSIVQHGDQLLAQQRGEGDAPDTTLLATDQQRSVLQTLKADHPPQPITYSPYGHRTVESGLLSLLGFNGERPDPVTGCYLLGNGYRAFNPVLMRFNSPDSLSPFGKGGLNPYAYCTGNPISNTDPTGHFSLKMIQLLENYKPPLKIPRPFSKTIPDSKLAGFHGSSSRHKESLEKGVRNADIAAFGPGFYATQDIEFAAKYAQKSVYKDYLELIPTSNPNIDLTAVFPYQNTSSSPAVTNTSYHLWPSTPEIFTVHIENYSNLVPNKDFVFAKNNTLVLPETMHKNIKAAHLKTLASPPTPWTKNLTIRAT
ncbi:RHS repeat-associated core domain-containing protein [Pseudomonas sp. Sample_16]|uniref:RHS repeat-associated core domain-containing protein n=1 Tax=Pseudomonas sp. Sample_16 TaxID=2448263 RepID=UPI001032BB7B|nr:RHS repeat-associated core domain-containing protein [Pseudomonas sp. Sample_16]